MLGILITYIGLYQNNENCLLILLSYGIHLRSKYLVSGIRRCKKDYNG